MKRNFIVPLNKKLKVKQLCSFLLIAFSFLSFSQKKKYPVRDTGIKIQSNKTKLFKVSGQVMQTSSYCGGAAPTEEMMRQNEIPKPFVGKRFYLKKGKENDAKQQAVLTFTTDEKGEFEFNVAPGIYCFLLEPQMKNLSVKEYNVKGFLTADAACLTKWWKQPYFLLVVKNKDVDGIKFNFHMRCFVSEDLPCVDYVGEMPP
jgi:hypothetical protein